MTVLSDRHNSCLTASGSSRRGFTATGQGGEPGQERGKVSGIGYSGGGLSFIDAGTLIGAGFDGIVRVWRIDNGPAPPPATTDSTQPPVVATGDPRLPVPQDKELKTAELEV